MAKWGEGDPRWIVEERPDATNVNNWHWTERNASAWSIERLKELFKNFKINSEIGDLKVLNVEKCEGDASANNRKGKLIFFYEWNLVLKWEGRLVGGSEKPIEGKITIPNLSEENQMSEVDISVSVNTSTEESEILKTTMYTLGRDQIRKQLELYLSGLREEFSKGMILPKKDDVKTEVNNLTSGFNKKINMQPVVNSKPNEKTAQNVATSDLKMTEKFQCEGKELYDVLTNKNKLEMGTRSSINEFEPKPDGQFSLFNGNITGKFVELKEPKKIVQTWRYKQWPTGHYSRVTIEIEEKGDHSELTLKQTGVPKSEVDVTRQNWERYYWETIKRTFGWGAYFDYT